MAREKCTKSATITPAQIRAARALLDWSRGKLATKTGVALRTLVRIEAGEVVPRSVTIDAIYDALLKAGVEFVEQNGGGPGVRMKHPARTR